MRRTLPGRQRERFQAEETARAKAGRHAQQTGAENGFGESKAESTLCQDTDAPHCSCKSAACAPV